MFTPIQNNDLPSRPTWLEISASALTNNVRRIRSLIGAGCLLMGVVKANAYGHDAVASTPILLNAGCDRFAVAALPEALELRNAGIQAPILVMGYSPAWLAPQAIQAQLTTTLYDWETAQVLEQTAAAAHTTALVHVKVNTGMNRLGVAPTEAPSFLQALRRLPHIQVEGIFTHFATADLADKTFAATQFEQFSTLLQELQTTGLRPVLAHAANSAAMLTMPQTHLDMVRCGISLYGLPPDAEETRLPTGFQPALAWKAQVAHVLHLQTGESVSYGREFVATQPITAAVIPVGYADGFPRRPYHWGNVLIHGQPAPILGRVCMDQTIVDVTDIVKSTGAVRQGDEVVLIGQQGNAAISAEEVGVRLRTINYDVVSRILSRVPRKLVYGTVGLDH